jgi:IBR domain, a half RING-finger domain
MNECLICFSNRNLLNLPLCDCIFCQDCVLSWYSTKIQQISYRLNDKLRCPNEKCLIEYDIIQDFIYNEDLDSKMKAQISDDLFKKYLHSTPDIFSCPKMSCNYYGFKFLKNNHCDKPYKCESCGTEWMESIHNNYFLERITKIFKMDLSEFFSNIYEEAFTESCPECSVYISRNGGCNHMTCKHCKYEFCWYCKQKYANHNLNLCMTHIIVKNYISFLILFLMISKFGWHITIFEALYVILLFILKYVVLFNFLGFYFLVYLKYMCYFIKEKNNQKKKRRIVFSLFGFLSLYLIYFLNHKGLLIEMIFSWMIEVFLISIVYIFSHLGMIIYHNWIEYVK